MDDLISRQAAIDAVLGVIPHDDYWTEQVERALKQMPSEQRTGTWIYTPIEPLGYICSECRIGCCRFKYCPNCGARMEGE